MEKGKKMEFVKLTREQLEAIRAGNGNGETDIRPSLPNPRYGVKLVKPTPMYGIVPQPIDDDE